MSSGSPAEPVFAQYQLPNGKPNRSLLFRLVDSAGAIGAYWYGKKTHLVTLGINRLEFGTPIDRFVYLTTRARLTAATDKLMEFEVDVNSEKMAPGGSMQKLPVAKCFVLFRHFLPQAPPPPNPETAEEHALIQKSQLRQTLYKAEKQQIAQLGAEDAFNVSRKELLPKTELRWTPGARVANFYNKLFGGETIRMLCEAGEKGAAAFAKVPLQPVAMERILFEKPAELHKPIYGRPTVTRTWPDQTLEMQIDLFQTRQRIARSFMTFKTLNPSDTLPSFTPQTPTQQKRYQAAEIRRQIKQAELNPAVPPSSP